MKSTFHEYKIDLSSSKKRMTKHLLSEEPKKSFRTWLRFKRKDMKTFFQQIFHHELLNKIEKHCVFIGYPRSEHTLVAALLDAHPNMVISKGVDPLQYVGRGFKLSQIYSLYLTRAQRFVKKGSKSNGYSYFVPNQWNGKFNQLKVIGDKSGDLLSKRLLENPGILDRFLIEYQAKHKFIHVIRNPFDSISTLSARNKMTLEEATTYYFALCGKVGKARINIAQENWFDIKLEDLIADPQAWLARLCQFLGQETTANYLQDCSSVVFKSARQTRFTAQWTHRLIGSVETEVAKYPWLSNYSFESAGQLLNQESWRGNEASAL